ncbi:MAG TPA: hypothetical protein VF510_15930 [Ktedonobacterales bacterium]
MLFDRWRYDVKLLGRLAFFTPLLMMTGFALVGVFLYTSGVSPARFLSAGLEIFLPVAMGVIGATVSMHDPALELQITLPHSYAMTALRRLFCVTGWSACIALLSSGLIALFHLGYPPQQIQGWPMPLQVLATQMIWLVPLLWFVAVGLFLALLTHSRTASSALLAIIWIIEALFLGNIAEKTPWLRPIMLFSTTLSPDASYWLSSHIVLLLTALLLVPINWLLLRNTEGLLKGMSEAE